MDQDQKQPQSEPDQTQSNILCGYSELCNSYRAIDEFRSKLLGFLPLATGGGLFLLLTDKAKITEVQHFLGPIGIFGFVITLGLYFYELYGIKKCTHLIWSGRKLEQDLHIDNGQFKNRAPGVMILINEPLAATVIYPAVLAAWAFIALAAPYTELKECIQPSPYARYAAILVFVIGLVTGCYQNLALLGEDKKRRELEQSKGIR